jgi:hypothetical protein
MANDKNPETNENLETDREGGYEEVLNDTTNASTTTSAQLEADLRGDQSAPAGHEPLTGREKADYNHQHGEHQ